MGKKSRHMTFRNPNTHEVNKSEVRTQRKRKPTVGGKAEKSQLCDRMTHKVRCSQEWQSD